MSTAPTYFSGNGKVPAPAEKSSFAKTCNRLSLFLKEKGNLTDFGMNVIGKSESSAATVDFLSAMESPVEKPENSISHLPQYVSLDSFSKPDDSRNEAGSSKPTEQMTIFYGGRVLVFDDISADKARDLISAAIDASVNNQIQNRVQLASTSDSSFGSQEILPGLNGLDLPIARRVSLHKFLAKRKDRATVRAPYQLHNPFSKHKFDLNLKTYF